jgi:hypothetical protein
MARGRAVIWKYESIFVPCSEADGLVAQQRTLSELVQSTLAELPASATDVKVQRESIPVKKGFKLYAHITYLVEESEV